MVGRSILTIMPPDRPHEESGILERLRRGERIEHFETRRLRKNGELVDVSLSVSPVRDARGRIIGAAKIARDITAQKAFHSERERLLSQERRARADAEAASRAKDTFLATMSHELRTPLSPILAWARMLKTGGLSPERAQQAVDTIARNARVQSQLIDDLLDVSRITSGKLRLDVRPVELARIIDSAIDVVRPTAEVKAIRLQPVLDPSAGMVTGDPGRLQQVVWNLLSNAVKFTPKGGRVEIVLERVNSHVEIAVIDNGRGISREFLPHIFERFQQAESGTTRMHGGLGLGLAIVRHIVDLHGGTPCRSGTTTSWNQRGSPERAR